MMKDIIDIDTLFLAIKNTLGRMKGLSDEDVMRICYMIFDFFGFEERIIDNILRPKERDLFYDLEEIGILKTLEEEITLPKGKLWRIHYWVLNKDKIIELARERKREDMSERVYNEIDESVWREHFRREGE